MFSIRPALNCALDISSSVHKRALVLTNPTRTGKRFAGRRSTRARWQSLGHWYPVALCWMFRYQWRRIYPALNIMKFIISLLLTLSFCGWRVQAGDWVVYEGKKGPGKAKHIVFLTGDEEYRSEEGLPMLAQILARHHGFKCTVLFSIKNGEIDPNTRNNEPGIEALDSADLCVMLLRFREWPDEQMKHFVDYYLAGKPIIALRTSTHAFAYGKNSTSAYKKFDWSSNDWKKGFGRQVLGETWVDHWGKHKSEATRGIVEPTAAKHPILRGVKDIFGDTDVYEAHPPPDVTILVHGQVLKGMKPTDPPADYSRKNALGAQQGINDPMQPVVWTRQHTNETGKVNKVLTTTMGSATDLQSEGLRRLLVNAAYWATGLERKIPRRAKVEYVAPFTPTMYGFNGARKGVKPAEHELK
jgi:hypothetical protein